MPAMFCNLLVNSSFSLACGLLIVGFAIWLFRVKTSGRLPDDLAGPDVGDARTGSYRDIYFGDFCPVHCATTCSGDKV